jgi:acyl-CoA synthetase (AMP-forming)/AMP-acid ligase II
MTPEENLELGTRMLEVGSVAGLLARGARAFPDHDLLVLPGRVQALWPDEPARLSYGAMEGLVDRLAHLLSASGWGQGHRVALSLENRPSHFVHWLALNRLGASAVPLNPDLTADETRYVLRHSGAAMLVRLPGHATRLDPLAKELGIMVAGSGGTMPHAAAGACGNDLQDADALGREAALVYTSGTTGRPKGCILSNRFFLNWAWWYGAQQGNIRLRPGRERLMNPLPAFHVNAMGHSFMGMLGCGGAQIIIDRFHPRDWWDTARETGATIMHYLGVIPAILLQIAPAGNDRDHGLRFGLGGGVHPDHHAAFEARFGVPLLEGWAMTETGGAGTFCDTEDPRPVGTRSIGRPDRPGPPLRHRLVDEHGRDVASGEPGELWLRADSPDPRQGFFSGYLHDPDATAAAWSGDWLHTGDIMRQGADGRLHFVDRKKNIIRRSGENIAAAEIEAVIGAVPGVRQAVALATPDPLRGDEVLVVVVPAEGADESALAEAVMARCTAHLAYHKLPAYLVFVDGLPTTSTQKIQRQAMGDLARDPLAQPRSLDWRARKAARRRTGPAA